MWLGVWVSRRRGEARWASFVQRYWEFRKEDVVLICLSHHAEIHEIYDKIIERHKKKLGKALARYTWPEAEDLMNQLEAACLEWERKQTPGSDPLAYTERRQRLRVAKNKRNRERQTRNRNH